MIGSYEATNKSSAAIDADAYFQLVRDGKPAPGDSTMVPTFTGYAIYTDQERFQKVEFSDVEKGKAKYTQKSWTAGWASWQHYFVSAWLPAGNLLREFYVRRPRQRPVCGRRDSAGGAYRARAERRAAGAALCGAAGAGQASRARTGPRAHRGLRLAHGHRRATVLAAALDTPMGG